MFKQTSEAISLHQLNQKVVPASSQRTQLIIPVVIHIVSKTDTENITDEMVMSQLEALNRDFNKQNNDIETVPFEFSDRVANIGLTFCRAAKTPDGYQTNGIVRVWTDVDKIGITDGLFFDSTGGSTAWDTERYLNIWVANTGEYISGYASYPEALPQYKTGVVINPKYFGKNTHPKYGMGRTLVHEVGHYFGLKHVWSNDPFCEKDDDIEDTPKQKHPHNGCPSYPQASCTESDMFMNFMDYVDDSCMNMFTEGQKERIWANIEGYRKGLLSNHIEYHCLDNYLGKDFEFDIAPNPFKDVIVLSFPHQTNRLLSIQIFDMIGQLRKDIKLFSAPSNEIRIDGLQPGLYFVKIGTTVKSIIKV